MYKFPHQLSISPSLSNNASKYSRPDSTTTVHPTDNPRSWLSNYDDLGSFRYTSDQTTTTAVPQNYCLYICWNEIHVDTLLMFIWKTSALAGDQPRVMFIIICLTEGGGGVESEHLCWSARIWSRLSVCSKSHHPYDNHRPITDQNPSNGDPKNVARGKFKCMRTMLGNDRPTPIDVTEFKIWQT